MGKGDEYKTHYEILKELKNVLKDIIYRGENKGDNKSLIRNNVKRNKLVT